jgi:hypothetical protein
VKLTDKAIGKHPLPDLIRENLSRYLADEGTEPLRIRS